MLNPLPALLSMMLVLGVLSNALPAPASDVPGTTTTTTTMIKPNSTSITTIATNTTRAITTTTTNVATTPSNTQTLSHLDLVPCIFIPPEQPLSITSTKSVSATATKNKLTSTTQPTLSSTTAPPKEKMITSGKGDPSDDIKVIDPATKQKALEALRAKVEECEKECLATADTDPYVCLKGLNGRNYRMNSCRLRVIPCSRPNVTYEIIDMSECPDWDPWKTEE